jgi:hypothetical protein
MASRNRTDACETAGRRVTAACIVTDGSQDEKLEIARPSLPAMLRGALQAGSARNLKRIASGLPPAGAESRIGSRIRKGNRTEEENDYDYD